MFAGKERGYVICRKLETIAERRGNLGILQGNTSQTAVNDHERCFNAHFLWENLIVYYVSIEITAI